MSTEQLKMDIDENERLRQILKEQKKQTPKFLMDIRDRDKKKNQSYMDKFSEYLASKMGGKKRTVRKHKKRTTRKHKKRTTTRKHKKRTVRKHKKTHSKRK